MALTTSANVKAFKNITGSDHDAEITRLIPAVDAFIKEYCNRTVLEETTITEYHSTGEGQIVLMLKNWPVSSITSLYDDPYRSYGAGTLIASTDYILDESTGIVSLDGVTFSGGLKNVKVVYVGGYASGSSQLKLMEQAAIELVWLARQKGDQALIGLTGRSVADGRTDVFSMDWPTGVREILDKFKKLDH